MSVWVPASSSSDNPLLLRLGQILSSLSNDYDRWVSELVNFLNFASDSIAQEPENQESETNASQILTEIHRYISSPSLDQEFVDALSFELPKAVARFACASTRCLEMAQTIVLCFTDKCSPRDMLSILCDALSSPNEMFNVPNYYAPLLGGLPKVFVLIQRRQFEQVKAAVPIILGVLKATSSEFDDEDTRLEDLFHKAVNIADSIKTVCTKLEGRDKDKLRALFGLFVLQILALVSMGMRRKVSQSLPLVLQLSHFLRYCGLSYIGLIMGSDVDELIDLSMGDDVDDCASSFSHIRHGASLAVIWGYWSNEVAIAAEADLAAVKNELQCNQAKRWLAVGMLKHLFSCVNLPWDLKQQAVDFLLSIMDDNMPQTSLDETVDYSTYMPSLYASLQTIQAVIMYSPDLILRKKAFAAFKRVLADVPISFRFDILKALIKNSDSSSMIALLLDRTKEEMLSESSRRTVESNGVFWGPSVLELVELVLRPAKGGPPSLPEYTDAVLSALNLYRFILITESTGKTNNTGVLSKDNLQKAYSEWLLPLRTFVTGIAAENQKDYDELTFDILCALNPVELVLYRCIELAEENLKQFA